MYIYNIYIYNIYIYNIYTTNESLFPQVIHKGGLPED